MKDEIQNPETEKHGDNPLEVPRFVLPTDAVRPKCDECGYRMLQIGDGWGCQHCGHGQTGCYWKGKKRRTGHEWYMNGTNQICRQCGLVDNNMSLPDEIRAGASADCSECGGFHPAGPCENFSNE